MKSSRTSGRRAAERERTTAAPGTGRAASKVCVSCGRTIEWRAKWARSWVDVKYCSDACRRRGVPEGDHGLEAVIVEELRKRSGGAPIDLDEVSGADGAGDASARRERVRRAARRLAERGVVEWMQDGRPVAPSTARGRVSIRLGKDAPQTS